MRVGQFRGGQLAATNGRTSARSLQDSVDQLAGAFERLADRLEAIEPGGARRGGRSDKVTRHVRRYMPFYALATVWALMLIILPTRQDNGGTTNQASALTPGSSETIDQSGSGGVVTDDGPRRIVRRWDGGRAPAARIRQSRARTGGGGGGTSLRTLRRAARRHSTRWRGTRRARRAAGSTARRASASSRGRSTQRPATRRGRATTAVRRTWVCHRQRDRRRRPRLPGLGELGGRRRVRPAGRLRVLGRGGGGPAQVLRLLQQGLRAVGTQGQVHRVQVGVRQLDGRVAVEGQGRRVRRRRLDQGEVQAVPDPQRARASSASAQPSAR